MEIAPLQYDINDSILLAVIAPLPFRDKTAEGWGTHFMAGSMVGNPANNDDNNACTLRELPAILENNKGRIEWAWDKYARRGYWVIALSKSV
jgi:hypothetical protein